MVSRENAVIVASLVVAIAAWYLIEAFVTSPPWASWAVLIGVGVLLPTLVNEHLGTGRGGRRSDRQSFDR